MKVAVLIIVVLFYFVLPGFAGLKNDTIYFQSGNKLTCEFKNLQNNLLHVSTEDAGKLYIEWDKIDSLYIKQFLVIETKTGERITGTVSPADSVQYVVLTGWFGERRIQQMSIVRMYPFRQTFLKRLSGSLGGGFGYTKANELSKFDINSFAKYTAEKNIIDFNYDANWSDQKELEATKRHNISSNYYRLLNKKYFYTIFLSAEINSELGLDLRTNVGGGLGNNFIFNNRVIALGSIGAQVNREFTADSIANNAEGIIKLSYNLFKYTSPKIDLTITSSTYPNLIDFERIRTTLDSKLRWEILSDFFIKYTFYYTFDSKPLSSEANKSDWSTTIGFEYSFN